MSKLELNHKAMLKWVLRHKSVATAIPGYTTFDQLDENFSVAANLEYSKEEQDFLRTAQVELAQSFCTRCEECMPSCPRNVDIPTLMGTYMYAYQYCNIEHACATEKTIPKESGLDVCRTCDACEAKCPKSLDVAQRIDALKDLNFA
jgi:predicted aldo/keto reductase-like oxidoreductase